MCRCGAGWWGGEYTINESRAEDWTVLKLLAATTQQTPLTNYAERAMIFSN
ncbi:hypothetical protein MNV_130004 [Candidatus Methanoperedens nitroreducens]|uniref:Uncharacterized protein n=1 Tax=Candidatus Methanoperedens nitratireducens TaxID=1392998 RepID=A0A284VKC0_9EURY|nr:hypothetical protein MNV_130004 [Candidatus Methanoperedens nitroreducens]